MYGYALNSCAGSDGLQFLKENSVLYKLVLYVMSGCRLEKLFIRHNASSWQKSNWPYFFFCSCNDVDLKSI